MEIKCMKVITIISVIFATLVIAACVPSLHPLYTVEDLLNDDSLVGAWEDKEAGETWTISKVGQLEYRLCQTDGDGRTGEFVLRLVKVDSKLLLDLTPARTTFLDTDLHRGQLLPTHNFVRIEKRPDAIEISTLEMNWLKDLIAENPTAIRHEKVNGDVVLTSSPKETQRFLKEHMATRGAFSEPTVLTRKKRSL